MRSNGKWLGVFVLLLTAGLAMTSPSRSLAQEPAAAPAAQPVSDRVTINVNNVNMSDVLNAFSRQTGRSIVIGPNVTNTVSLRLNDTPWSEALDVILQPYGYGYRTVGDTVVVYTTKDLQALSLHEPLVTEVFNMKYLNATDVFDVVSSQLTTNRGRIKIVTTIQEGGWEFQTSRSSSQMQGSGSGVGIGEQTQRIVDIKEKEKSKSFIVTDTEATIDMIRALLNRIDRMPGQVLIEARFVEVKTDFLRDLGVEWGTGADGATPYGFAGKGNAFAAGGQSISSGVRPAAFNPASESLQGTSPFNAGMALQFQQLSGFQFNVLLHAIQEDNSANILSSPRVVTMDNQAATIIVGTKYPIIETQTSGVSGSQAATLKYYENIGIQLNCIPQICEDGFVNMIVHPAVSEQVGEVTGAAGQGTEPNRYPVLSVREAQTRIMIKTGSTVVIGGLLKQSNTHTQIKVPWLGNIPLLGWLFRRDTQDKEKVDLLIFLTATIVPSSSDAQADAKMIQDAREATRLQTERAATMHAEAERAVTAEMEARMKAEERVRAEEKAVEKTEVEKDSQFNKERLRRENEDLIAREKAAAKDAETARLKAEAKAREEAAAKVEADRLAQEKAAREAEKVRRPPITDH